MRICIVDDEKQCRDSLKGHLLEFQKRHDKSFEIDIFSESKDFFASYSSGKYDLLFFDIYIDDATGMDLAKFVREKTDRDIIVFCTTSLEDMPQAFRYHAFEYIIKPAEYERVEKVLCDAIALLPSIESFIELQIDKVATRVALSNIISVCTQGHYLDISVAQGNVLTVRMSLKEFSEKVGGERRFLSINKGLVVNMDHIDLIEDKTCFMDNEDELPIRVRDSAKIKSFWQDYNFEKIRKGQRRL